MLTRAKPIELTDNNVAGVSDEVMGAQAREDCAPAMAQLIKPSCQTLTEFLNYSPRPDFTQKHIFKTRSKPKKGTTMHFDEASTRTQFKLLISRPGANQNNTTITVNPEEHLIYVNTDVEFYAELFDFEGSEIFNIDETIVVSADGEVIYTFDSAYNPDSIKATVKDGLILITADVKEGINVIITPKNLKEPK